MEGVPAPGGQNRYCMDTPTLEKLKNINRVVAREGRNSALQRLFPLKSNERHPAAFLLPKNN